MAKAYRNILDTIGNTPLVKLNKLGEGILSEIYLKVETVNPGGSIKDRVGKSMIEAAEKEGLLKPGGTIIEATAGNTGVGLAMAAAVKGYRCIFVMPDKMSPDKISLLQAYGAEVIVTPSSVPPDSPESYNGVADRLSREIPGAFRPNQFTNHHNPKAHYLTTGPEIWEASEGKVDVLVAGMGTGGTISGTARYLKEKNPNLIVVGADPEGSILSGDSPRSYKVEGIGEDFIPKTFNRQVVDEFVRVSDKESFQTARRLAREEGILAGGSAGTALAAALKYARRLMGIHYIVVILPDTGRNYLTKIYSDDWMKENGFWDRNVDKPVHVGVLLEQKKQLPPLITVAPGESLQEAVRLMQDYQISQLPVMDGDSVIGSVNEASLMKGLHDGLDFTNQDIRAVMGRPLPVLDSSIDISEAFRILLTGASGIIVKEGNQPAAVITRTDLIDYWVHHKKEPALK
jgi:cystathionine beta-synthase